MAARKLGKADAERARHAECVWKTVGSKKERKEVMATMPWSAVAVIAATWVLGCGSSVPPPNDQYAAAQADVGRAQAGGAPGIPDAKLHLQFATEDLQKAKQLMGLDNARAALVSSVASTEAQLALALARQAEARQDASTAEAELQKNGR